jgi:hypothetical protein
MVEGGGGRRAEGRSGDRPVSVDALKPLRWPCHGRELAPIDGRSAWPLIEAWDPAGDPLERVEALLGQLESQALAPLACWRSWQEPGTLSEASRACWGLRRFWLPEQGDPHRHWQFLRGIGRQQLPVKLVLGYDAGLASWGDWASLEGWWVAAPSDGQECRALLKRLVDEEWPSVLLLPAYWQEGGQTVSEFEWGAGPAQVEGGVCLLAAPDALDLARAAQAPLQALGLQVTVLPCTSIAPLPVSAIRAREQGLVLVIDRSRSWSGIGGLWQRVQPAVDCSYCGADQAWGKAPSVADIVTLVRMQLGV